MAAKPGDGVTAEGSELSLPSARALDDGGHQPIGMALPTRFIRRFDMRDVADAITVPIRGEGRAAFVVEFVLMGGGIVAETCHGPHLAFVRRCG